MQYDQIQTVTHGEKATRPSNDTTKQYNIFKYWMDENNVEFDFDTAIVRDTILYS